MPKFVFSPAPAFEDVDDEYQLAGHPDITIQVSPYMAKYGERYTVNVWAEEEQAMYHYPFNTLTAAKRQALDIAKHGLPKGDATCP